MPSILLCVGTVKGLFLFESDASQSEFKLVGHHLQGWEVTAILARQNRGTIDLLCGTTHYAYGAVLRRSRDGGTTWEQPEGRPAYPSDSNFKTNRIWQLTASNGALYAGIDEAGLFISRDDATTWDEIKSLTNHPTRNGWQPGGGGLCLHTIVHDYSNQDRMWVGISAVGVFRTEDAGKTWDISNTGLKSVATGSDEPSTAYCVHKIVQHSQKPDTLYMQFHGGVYVSNDAAKTWQTRESGLESNFGFPMVITPKGTLLIAPLKADATRYFADGKFAIYRSKDDAQNWNRVTRGLPSGESFAGVLRDAMTVDKNEGVYIGTTSGNVVHSTDAGESWRSIDVTLPRILCVRAISHG